MRLAGHAQAGAYLDRAALWDQEPLMHYALGALAKADGACVAVHQEVVEPVLERAWRRCAEQPGQVGVVLAEIGRGRRRHLPHPGAPVHAGGAHGAVRLTRDARPRCVVVPGPRVTRPELRRHVHWVRGAAVVDGDEHQHVVRPVLGIFDHHVEVSARHHACVGQLVLPLVYAAAAVGVHQLLVGECRMRVAVQHLHVAVRRRAIDEEVLFLHVLPMVALVVGEAE